MLGADTTLYANTPLAEFGTRRIVPPIKDVAKNNCPVLYEAPAFLEDALRLSTLPHCLFSRAGRTPHRYKRFIGKIAAALPAAGKIGLLCKNQCEKTAFMTKSIVLTEGIFTCALSF